MSPSHACVALAALAVAVLLAPAVLAGREDVTVDYSFDEYMAEFSLSFPESELAARKAVFAQRLRKIVAHNADMSQTWRMGVNHMTALFDEERRAMNGHRRIDHSLLDVQPTEHVSRRSAKGMPTSFDWRTHLPSVISAVKDQGMCGSCWAFASTEAMESAYALLTGQLPDASPQNILESPNPDQCGGTGGCQGGTASVAYSYLLSTQNGGIASIWRYPYLSYTGSNFAPLNASNPAKAPVAFISGYSVLPVNEEPPLLDALVEMGPITVSVDASNWFEYSSGIFSNCSVDATIDHAVVLVAFDEVSYTIRNSWSPAWGEDGYIRLARPAVPVCGIDHAPNDGVACKSSPSTLPVCGTCGVLSSSVYPIASAGPAN